MGEERSLRRILQDLVTQAHALGSVELCHRRSFCKLTLTDSVTFFNLNPFQYCQRGFPGKMGRVSPPPTLSASSPGLRRRTACGPGTSWVWSRTAPSPLVFGSFFLEELTLTPWGQTGEQITPCFSFSNVPVFPLRAHLHLLSPLRL